MLIFKVIFFEEKMFLGYFLFLEGVSKLSLGIIVFLELVICLDSKVFVVFMFDLEFFFMNC